MLVTSFAEILSIGSILPFLGALAAPDHIFELSATQPIINFFEISRSEQILLPLTLIFIVATLFASSLRLLMLWANTRISYAIGADLGVSIYRRTLYQPYAVHCARNSSEIINGVSNKTVAMISIITHLLSIISAVIILMGILVVLLSVSPAIALIAFGGFSFIYLAIVRLTRANLIAGSSIIANESTQVIRSLQEGLGGIRDVLIDGTQDTYCEVYRKADFALRKAQASSHFIQGSPRFAVEGLAMVLIASLAYFLVQGPDGIVRALPLLGVLALSAQRLLPLLQQAYGSWTVIQSGKISLQDGLDLLDQPLPDYSSKPSQLPITFRHQLKLAQISFHYEISDSFVLNDLSFIISKGDRVGFIGTTGSGKSTTLDIIMGLLEPTEGALIVDEQIINNLNRRAWQARIAHVPQSIFLSDTTIEENIAFGVPRAEIDPDRVRQSALQAQLDSTIRLWPRGYKTLVGERGIRLSGGQRQRIGIARALYKRADVLIFDEATSALDEETEQAVMQAIESLSRDITMLIIAHRHSTLKNCTKIIELDAGRIKKIGSYQDIIELEATDL
jgi:ATP-binding cassette subfamily B protein